MKNKRQVAVHLGAYVLLVALSLLLGQPFVRSIVYPAVLLSAVMIAQRMGKQLN